MCYIKPDGETQPGCTKIIYKTSLYLNWTQLAPGTCTSTSELINNYNKILKILYKNYNNKNYNNYNNLTVYKTWKLKTENVQLWLHP